MPDPSFVFAQSLSGLTAAMFLFLIASGLSLIFGVLRVLNFAHGTFYMLGAYAAYQVVQWIGTGPGMFWIAAIGAALAIAVLGGLVERFLFRHLYGKEELYQLLFTYALVLMLGDLAKVVWGKGQLSVSRPPSLSGALNLFGVTVPHSTKPKPQASKASAASQFLSKPAAMPIGFGKSSPASVVLSRGQRSPRACGPKPRRSPDSAALCAVSGSISRRPCVARSCIPTAGALAPIFAPRLVQ